MSRGLGKLQRALLAELNKRENWTTAIELMTSGCQDGIFSRAHDVAVRRALHGLHKRDLVGLQHHGLNHFKSEFLGRNVLVQAEVLVVWLPGKNKAPPHGWHGGLNPKRCVRDQLVDDATFTIERAEQRRIDLQRLETVISQGVSGSKRYVVRKFLGTQRLRRRLVTTQSSQIQPDAHGLAATGDHPDQERPSAAKETPK